MVEQKLSNEAVRLLKRVARDELKERIDIKVAPAKELLAESYIAILHDERGSAAYQDDEPMRWVKTTDRGHEWLRLHGIG